MGFNELAINKIFWLCESDFQFNHGFKLLCSWQNLMKFVFNFLQPFCQNTTTLLSEIKKLPEAGSQYSLQARAARCNKHRLDHMRSHKLGQSTFSSKILLSRDKLATFSWKNIISLSHSSTCMTWWRHHRSKNFKSSSLFSWSRRRCLGENFSVTKLILSYSLPIERQLFRMNFLFVIFIESRCSGHKGCRLIEARVSNPRGRVSRPTAATETLWMYLLVVRKVSRLSNSATIFNS